MKFVKGRNDLISESKKFNIPEVIWDINKLFNKNHFKLYIVGGSVRDFLKGDKPKDFDLCTDALPEDVVRILTPHYKVQEQGKAFGVVVVFTKEVPEGMEVATFREDNTAGRAPKIKVGGVTLKEDSQRRDLSINAMYYDLGTKKIIDPQGGQEDLKNGVIRMVGNPSKRIEEDSLRILRTMRFTCRYGSTLDKETKLAILKNNKLTDISMERIWDSQNGEFIKGFKQSKDFQQYLDFVTEFKLWGQILPGLKINPKIKNQDNLFLVMSQLLKDNDVSVIKKVLTKCAVPNVVILQVMFLINLLSFKEENVIAHYKEKVRSLIEDETIKSWFEINNIRDKNITKFIEFKTSVNGEDVMKEFNLKPSKELGDKINELEIEKFKSL